MKTIDSLERGLHVLRSIEEYRGQSVAELQKKTGVPKSSLLRIVHTLEKSGYVWKAIGDGLYRRSISLAGRQRSDERSTEICEIAAPFLSSLRQKVLWPSDILIIRDHQLELGESSRRHSSLGVTHYEIGARVDMILSGVGRAYLAFCSPEERAAVLAQLHANPSPIARSRQVLKNELDEILEQTRACGYGSRDPHFGGRNVDIEQFDDGFDGIAVPISCEGKVLACINLVWPRKYKLKNKIVRDHLADLQATAAAIADACV
jgi:IclR family transcriptional regulator, mhp operon transcriptional activator